jgi:hypothetical protein
VIYATLAVNLEDFEVVLIAVGEFPDENHARQKGQANLKLERPLSYPDFAMRAFGLEEDAVRTRDGMKTWFLQLGMNFADAEKRVQASGYAIAKTLGIPINEVPNDRQK